jgi:SNF2 family DNA or RNA helicase
MFTPHQSKYFAYFLTREGLGKDDALRQSLSSARVDLNPHQVDAAMFALRSPLSKGVLLADEVGLGKTIEAALVLSQRWWESLPKKSNCSAAIERWPTCFGYATRLMKILMR